MIATCDSQRSPNPYSRITSGIIFLIKSRVERQWSEVYSAVLLDRSLIMGWREVTPKALKGLLSVITLVYVCISVCLYVCMSVCLSVCLWSSYRSQFSTQQPNVLKICFSKFSFLTLLGLLTFVFLIFSLSVYWPQVIPLDRSTKKIVGM